MIKLLIVIVLSSSIVTVGVDYTMAYKARTKSLGKNIYYFERDCNPYDGSMKWYLENIQV